MTPPKDWDRLQHDLKNHLGIIIGFIELLMQETPESDARRADMEEIHRAAKTCLELIDPQSGRSGGSGRSGREDAESV